MAPSSDRESMDLETLRQKAKKAYLEGDYHNSLKLNQQLHATAIAQQVFKYQVLGLRFIGLCYYRLDDLGKSETNLQKALDLIANDDTADNSRQRLLITNHLCATIRRQGKYDEADKLFRTSLEEATLPHHLNERCRLMGNYGALLDELGQRARADDCYARFEELAELDDKPGRLANARGLAARSAELRGDTDTARKKYEDEKRLAEKAGDKLRILAASIHAARQLPAKESVARLEEILADDSSKISQSRQIDAHLAIAAAQFRLAKEHEPTALSSSWYHTNKVLNLAGTSHEGNDSHWEKRANALEQMARVCQRAGLHGEAFYYFEKVVNLRYEKYRPLEANKRIRSMAQSRLETLKDLAAMMVDEAHQVDRDREQRNTLNKLLKHVYGEKKPPQSQVSEKYIDVWTWADTERKKAKERWKE
ncbi:MAG TPA: tetratricopeptide repeat protein, partial [Nannocystis exedens]|nr:tetratricopeptide repeat protein [Nannocystis exedens]